MRSAAEARSPVSKALFAAMLALAVAGPAHSQKAPAQTDLQVQAREILMRMAGYLGGAQSYSVSLRAGYDAVQKSGQKIEFGETRKITLARPDKLRIEGESSDGAKTLTVFSGTEIVLAPALATMPDATPSDTPALPVTDAPTMSSALTVSLAVMAGCDVVVM